METSELLLLYSKTEFTWFKNELLETGKL